MIDRFDREFDGPAPPPASSRQYDVAPAGEHAVEIAAAERRRLPWRDVYAMALRLRVGPGIAFVFADVPDDLPWLRRHLANALGIEPELCFYPDKLVGRRVRVILGHIEGRDGRTRAIVKRWVPLPPHAQRESQRPSRPEAAPTATLVDAINDWAKQPPPARVTDGRRSRNAVKRHEQDDDGIPF